MGIGIDCYVNTAMRLGIYFYGNTAMRLGIDCYVNTAIRLRIDFYGNTAIRMQIDCYVNTTMIMGVLIEKGSNHLKVLHTCLLVPVSPPPWCWVSRSMSTHSLFHPCTHIATPLRPGYHCFHSEPVFKFTLTLLAAPDLSAIRHVSRA